MPQLAEPRRRTKWTLNPGRRALWNNDDSSGIKFGQGLMEKMGWKVGQGLGANKQGMTEPIRISTKNDCKGIGFKDTDSIEWVQQQNDFNDFLGKLSASYNTNENDECNDVKAVKTRSLEEKSKHSKARVHYHKFTRGKDLSKYSEKDLECILGSKKELSNDDIDDEKDGSDSCSKPEADQSMIYAGSMVDYFSEKIEKKRKDRLNKLSDGRDRGDAFKDLNGNENEKPEETSFVKEKKRKKDRVKKSKCRDGENVNEDFHGHENERQEGTSFVKEKKRKKDKPEKLSECRDRENAYEDLNGNENEKLEDTSFVKEKKRKNKIKTCNELMDSKSTGEYFEDRSSGDTVTDLNVNHDDMVQETSHRNKCLKVECTEDCSQDFNNGRDGEAGGRKANIAYDTRIVEIKQDDPDYNMTNVDLTEEENVRRRHGKGSSTNDTTDTTVACDMKGKKRKREEDKSDNEKEKKENDEKQLKHRDSDPYKTLLLGKKSAYVDNNGNKILDLLCCTNIDAFQGSNLKKLQGYGIIRYLTNESVWK